MSVTRSVKRTKYATRRAIATIECALCLPLFIAISFATIDLCSAMFLKESLTIAAYEGARVGIQRGGTNAGVIAKVRSFLDERDITYNTANVVTISNPGFDTADSLEHVTVTVTVPCSGNMPLTGNLFTNRSITADIVLRKEFANQ